MAQTFKSNGILEFEEVTHASEDWFQITDVACKCNIIDFAMWKWILKVGFRLSIEG